MPTGVLVDLRTPPVQVIFLPPIVVEPSLVAFVAVVELLPRATALANDALALRPNANEFNPDVSASAPTALEYSPEDCAL